MSQLYANQSTPHCPLKPCFFDAQTGVFCLRKFINPTILPLSKCKKQKSPSKMMGLCFWRRLRDSNPRYSYPYTNFPGLLVRPLWQVSYFILTQTFQLALPIAIGTTTLTSLLILNSKFQLALPIAIGKTISIQINWGCKNRKKTTGKI